MLRLDLTREQRGWLAILVRDIAAGEYGYVSRGEVVPLTALAMMLDGTEPGTPVHILNGEWVYIRRALTQVTAKVAHALPQVNMLLTAYEEATK